MREPAIRRWRASSAAVTLCAVLLGAARADGLRAPAEDPPAGVPEAAEPPAEAAPSPPPAAAPEPAPPPAAGERPSAPPAPPAAAILGPSPGGSVVARERIEYVWEWCCGSERDECGWPLDRCRRRVGRFDVALAGGLSLASAPEGLLGVAPPPAGAIDWASLEPPPAIAARASVSFRAGARWGVSARGTYWGRSDDAATVTGAFVSRTAPGGATDLSRPLTAELTSELTLWDAGAGVWMEWGCDPCLAFLTGLGARLAAVDETSRAGFATTGPGGFPAADGFAAADVRNDLLLGEVTLGLRWTPNWDWAFTLSATGLVGGVETEIDVTDFGVFSGGSHASRRTHEDSAFGVQLDALLQWRPGARWALTAGYSLLFLDGIQRGSTALDFGSSASGAVQAASATESLVTHALLLGVAFNF